MSRTRLIVISALAAIALGYGLGSTPLPSHAEADGGALEAAQMLNFEEITWTFVAEADLGTVTVGFQGQDQGGWGLFVDVMFADISVGLGSGLIATDIFVGGEPGRGTLIVSLLCMEGCAGPNAIFADGFESGDLSHAALDAGEVFVLVRTTAGDLGGFLQPVADEGVSGDAAVEVRIPAGLSPLGWCGRPTTSEDLFAANPSLQAFFVLDAETRSFQVADRRLPASLRRDVSINFMAGLFVRSESAFLLEISGLVAEEPLGFEFQELTLIWQVQAGLQIVANCGDLQSNTDILDGNAGVDRLFTFDPDTRMWTLIGRALPPSLRTEVTVPNSGAFVVVADRPTNLVMPCETAQCAQYFQALGRDLAQAGRR